VYAALLERCPLASQHDVNAYVHDERMVGADAIAVGLAALPVGHALDQLVAELRQQHGPDALDRAGLGHAERLSFPGHRLLVPWRDRDGRITTLQRRIVGARGGRDVPPYLFAKGRSVPAAPFGAELYDEAMAFLGDVPVVVTEGPLDCLARRKLARLEGERIVVLGAPSCTTARSEWAPYFDGRDVVIAFDADEAGDDGAQRFAETCCRGARSVEREHPRGAKDWGDVLPLVLAGGRAA
jgi:hypothetical protein